MGAMKPSGGFSPSRASFLMRVPEMKSKSSCLCKTETGVKSAQPARVVPSTAALPSQACGWKPPGIGGTHQRHPPAASRLGLQSVAMGFLFREELELYITCFSSCERLYFYCHLVPKLFLILPGGYKGASLASRDLSLTRCQLLEGAVGGFHRFFPHFSPQEEHQLLFPLPWQSASQTRSQTACAV